MTSYPHERPNSLIIQKESLKFDVEFVLEFFTTDIIHKKYYALDI